MVVTSRRRTRSRTTATTATPPPKVPQKAQPIAALSQQKVPQKAATTLVDTSDANVRTDSNKNKKVSAVSSSSLINEALEVKEDEEQIEAGRTSQKANKKEIDPHSFTPEGVINLGHLMKEARTKRKKNRKQYAVILNKTHQVNCFDSRIIMCLETAKFKSRQVMQFISYYSYPVTPFVTSQLIAIAKEEDQDLEPGWVIEEDKAQTMDESELTLDELSKLSRLLSVSCSKRGTLPLVDCITVAMPPDFTQLLIAGRWEDPNIEAIRVSSQTLTKLSSICNRIKNWDEKGNPIVSLNRYGNKWEAMLKDIRAIRSKTSTTFDTSTSSDTCTCDGNDVDE